MQASVYKIIFIGTPEYSVPTLQALIDDARFEVAAVVTSPDAKVGRRQMLTAPPVKVVAQKNNILIFQPAKLTGRDTTAGRLYDEITALRADIIITIAYGQIIPEKILKIPKYGCLNLHASLLPRYRGASPIQQAIINDDTETGVTLMQMDAGLDTGPVIAQEKIGIAKSETGETLHNKLAALSAEVAKKYIIKYIQGELKPQPQNDALASVAPKITREDGRIDWRKPAAEIERLVRGFYPWPGTWTRLRPDTVGTTARQGTWGDKILKIIAVSPEILNRNEHKPGTIFKLRTDVPRNARLPAPERSDGGQAVQRDCSQLPAASSLAVQCGTGALVIAKLQLAGKKPMTTAEFLRGYGDVVGVTLQ